MKKAASLFLLLCVSGLAFGQVTLTILHTNSHHGHPLPFFSEGVKDAGGLPARLSVVEKVRKENPNLLLLDAGNINTGNAISNLFKAKPDVLGYNLLGYDAMTIGHHDFDQGLGGLETLSKLAKFPFVTANIRQSTGEKIPFFRPYLIKEVGGIKVGIIGLTTPATLVIGNQAMKGQITIDSPVDVAKKLVVELRPKVDLLLLLTNLGMDKEGKGLAQKVVTEVPGIDLVIDGHTMQSIPEVFWQTNLQTSEKIPMMKAKFWGLEVGRIDIAFDKNRKIQQRDFSRIAINTDKAATPIPQHPEMLALLAPYQEEIQKQLQQTVGWNKSVLSEKPGIREESAFGNLMADGMLYCLKPYQPDFSIQNGGGIRDQLPEGSISQKDVYSALPFENSLVIVLQSGKKLAELFDRIAHKDRPFGGFPQLANAKVSLDFTQKKMLDLTIDGKALNPDKVYRVATHSYLASGGDGFDTFKDAEKESVPLMQRDCLLQYIAHLNGQFPHVLEGRVKVAAPN